MLPLNVSESLAVSALTETLRFVPLSVIGVSPVPQVVAPLTARIEPWLEP